MQTIGARRLEYSAFLSGGNTCNSTRAMEFGMKCPSSQLTPYIWSLLATSFPQYIEAHGTFVDFLDLLLFLDIALWFSKYHDPIGNSLYLELVVDLWCDIPLHPNPIAHAHVEPQEPFCCQWGVHFKLKIKLPATKLMGGGHVWAP